MNKKALKHFLYRKYNHLPIIKHPYSVFTIKSKKLEIKQI